MPRFEKPPYYITAYGLAVKRGYKGTLDEWLASLKGKQGEKVELRCVDKNIQWRWVPSTGALDPSREEDGPDGWRNLMDASDIAVESEIIVSDDGEGNVTFEADDRFKESSNFENLYSALQLLVEDISVKTTQQTEDLEQIKRAMDAGMVKLDTGMGLIIEDTKINIHKEGFEISSTYDENGAKIVRSEGTDNETTIFEAGADGITVTEAGIRCLIAGTHARFEDYSDGTDSERTACFWI